jgi:hypothetical protein
VTVVDVSSLLVPAMGSFPVEVCATLCSYYINKTKKPKNRASIRLAVKVGSIVEEEEERGVAHIVEHLAFSATSVRILYLPAYTICLLMHLRGL